MRSIFIVYLSLITPSLWAQKIFTITDNLKKIELKEGVTYQIDSTGNKPLEYIRRSFKGHPIKNGYPNFGDSPYPHILHFKLANQSSKKQKVSLITKGIDSLQTLIVTRDSVITFPITGSHIPVYQREKLSSYLINTFELAPGQEYSVWVRIRNIHYRLAASPFDLYSYEAGSRFILRMHFAYSIFIGGMFIIWFFSLMLVLLFKEKLYLYYLGCVSCALLIMLFYNDFIYLFTEKLPDILINKNIFGILSALVPVFYLLFAEQFLQVDLKGKHVLRNITRGIIGAQLIVMSFLVFTNQPLFQYRVIFYFFMASLSSLTLFHLYNSLRRNYFPAKLFLLATLPVTVTVILETFTNLHQIPVQSIHEYYYFTSLTEMLFLTWGIIYRFKIQQDEKYHLQHELIYVELKTQKEEQIRIAENLHDDVGSLLVAAKSQAHSFKNEFKGLTNYSKWDSHIQLIDEIYVKIRDLSHRMMKPSTTLLTMLQEKYKSIDLVDIYHEGLEEYTDKKLEFLFYTIVSELITNAIKYSKCTYISVQLILQDNLLTIIVEDNGIGFNFDSASKKGQGLRNTEKRVVETLHGEISIDSREGRGTIIILKIPVKSNTYETVT